MPEIQATREVINKLTVEVMPLLQSFVALDRSSKKELITPNEKIAILRDAIANYSGNGKQAIQSIPVKIKNLASEKSSTRKLSTTLAKAIKRYDETVLEGLKPNYNKLPAGFKAVATSDETKIQALYQNHLEKRVERDLSSLLMPIRLSSINSSHIPLLMDVQIERLIKTDSREYVQKILELAFLKAAAHGNIELLDYLIPALNERGMLTKESLSKLLAEGIKKADHTAIIPHLDRLNKIPLEQVVELSKRNLCKSFASSLPVDLTESIQVLLSVHNHDIPVERFSLQVQIFNKQNPDLKDRREALKIAFVNAAGNGQHNLLDYILTEIEKSGKISLSEQHEMAAAGFVLAVKNDNMKALPTLQALAAENSELTNVMHNYVHKDKDIGDYKANILAALATKADVRKGSDKMSAGKMMEALTAAASEVITTSTAAGAEHNRGRAFKRS